MIPREILLPESTSKAERAAPQSKSSPRQIMVKTLVPFHEQPGKCQDNNQSESFRGRKCKPHFSAPNPVSQPDREQYLSLPANIKKRRDHPSLPGCGELRGGERTQNSH